MATPQLSPGVLVREVDLTVGRADNVLDNIGAIAGPFAIGPVDEAIDITTENELLKVFGKPSSTDGQYEYWMGASSFLSYGGVLKVARVDGINLVNSNAIRNSSGVSTVGEPYLKIKNFDDYEANFADDIANYIFAAKNPGSWSNNLKVCVIDDKADQIVGITTTNPGAAGAVVGYGVTVALINQTIPTNGQTTTFNGCLKGIITGVRTDSTNGNSELDVKIVSRVSNATTSYSTKLNTTTVGLTTAGSSIVYLNSTAGITTADLFSITGVFNRVSIVSVSSTSVSLDSTVSTVIPQGTSVKLENAVSIASTETKISYSSRNQTSSIIAGNTLRFVNNSGVTTTTTLSSTFAKDWYDNQILELSNISILWSSIAPKPGTSSYANQKNAKSDEIHVVIIDDTGSVAGIQGNILEKHIGLSKATDAISAVNSPQKYGGKIISQFIPIMFMLAIILRMI